MLVYFGIRTIVSSYVNFIECKKIDNSELWFSLRKSTLKSPAIITDLLQWPIKTGLSWSESERNASRAEGGR